MAKFQTKLHLACSNDKLRPALTHVFFKDGYVYATDAHVAVKQKLEDHGFTKEDIEMVDGMALHKESFKEVYSANMFAVREIGFECFSKAGNSTMVPFIEGVTFPNVDAVIPRTEQVSMPDFNISALHLSKLKDLALNPANLKVKLFGENKAIIFESEGYEEVVLIMPILNRK